jgi:hypothetical protein
MNYAYELYGAIKDHIAYMDARTMFRHRSDDAFMEGRQVVIYRLEIQVASSTYYTQEEVSLDMQMAGHWTAQEGTVWRRVCRSALAGLRRDRPDWPEGLVLPAWLT